MIPSKFGQSYIGIENPKSVSNVGAALRAAGCFGGLSVNYTGTRYDRALPFDRSSNKHRRNVDLTKVASLVDACPQGFETVAVELVVGAEPLPSFTHPENAYYLFGPEDGSLDQTTVSSCDHVIYIPALSCLNLAASINVVLYDRMLKQKNIAPSDSLIRKSRDNRNRLVRDSSLQP